VLITICKKALSAKQNTSEQTGVEYIDFTEPTYTTEQVEQLIKGYNTVQRPQDFIERQIDDNYDDDSIEIITDIEEKVMETKRRGF
jgi:DNA-binding ferritin-like protein